MKENYSIQAENLMNSIYEDYILSIKIFHEIRITLNLLKKIKFKVKDRYRRLEDFSDIRIDKKTTQINILVYKQEYIKVSKEQLKSIKVDFLAEGQFLYIKKPKYTYNQLMELVEELEKYRNTVITKCSKAKLEPILRSRHGVENQFIESSTAQKTSKNCDVIYKKYEKMVNQVTEKKIEEILGKDFFQKYKKESLNVTFQ